MNTLPRHCTSPIGVYQFKNRINKLQRAKVEHVFGAINRVLGLTKVHYRGLDQNANRLFATCALANLFLVRAQLLQRGD